MAEKILDDILNNFLSLDCLLKWLSNKTTTNEENIFLNQYECNQVDFVSYFLIFLREQASRFTMQGDLQVYNAENPRKNSDSRMIKNLNTVTEKSAFLGTHQNPSSNIHLLDLESLESFPTLSSSSNNKSESKSFEITLNNSVHENPKDISEQNCRKVKLFSETLEGNSRGNNSLNTELEFLKDVELKQISGYNFAMSTPKSVKNNSLPRIGCSNTSDSQSEGSPKLDLKPKWKNYKKSPKINSTTSKSRSLGNDSTFRSKENKLNCRMTLGDFILSGANNNDNKKEKKNKVKKRIDPVQISSISEIKVNSSHNKNVEDLLDCSGISVLNETESAKLDNQKSVENTLCKELLNNTEDVPENENLSTCIENQAELEQTTFTSELEILSQIYSFLINENYCQNVMIELCFIISLLVVQDCKKKMLETDLDKADKAMSSSEGNKIFGTIHDCVYFAVETLWLQRNLLLFLNLSALKLLSENTRIEKFNLKLKEFLTNAYLKRQSDEEIKRHNRLMKADMQGFVSFQYETDNRENFTSNVGFRSFQKQRDLFYNILAAWEGNHLVGEWTFSTKLGSRIRSLFSLSSDPINMLHLSRLFRNQLIISCCGENQSEEDLNEEILQLLPSADPKKILRLRARLQSSPKRQGPCPLPDFTGHQEFYKDFILCSGHSSFNEHLKNSFCDEILRLNDTELTGDIEDDDSCMDEQTQKRYLQCTNILRILAKFLGFVEFLPYRGEKPHSDKVLNIFCSVRNSTLPLFDAFSCLNAALKKQKLILTIPWMVSYLSMIDPYSTHLKIYQNVWRLLILIYKHLKTFKNSKNSFYLTLVLGWIFQLPCFPSELFYLVVDEYNKNSADNLGISFREENKVGLDLCDFVEENVLYTVCPFLNEINAILSENIGCTVKHIRPVTTQENSFSKLQASKQLELRLESDFLHNQSSSTRKTVEFVTERVASVAIKHLIYDVLPKIKESAWAEIQSFSTVGLKEAEANAKALSEKCYKELLTTCERENWKISSKRSEAALQALLSNDLQGSIAYTCAKIVAREATEKVQRWMQNHITIDMVKEEFLSITRKNFAKFTEEAFDNALDSSKINENKKRSCTDSHHLPETGRGVVHDSEAWPASETLKVVREFIWKTYEEGSSPEEIEKIMEETLRTIESRNDMISIAEKTLLFLLVDLIVIFCICSENDVPQEIFKKFFLVLKSLEHQNYCRSSLKRIICPRNVALVRNDAKNKDKAWQNLGNFLMSLMEEEFLTKEQVETQLLSLLRINWDKLEGIQFSKFISHILQRYLLNNNCDKFSVLLEYMIETFLEDEPKSETTG